MRESIASFQKVLEVTFNSKSLIYSSCAWVRNMHENKTFVIGMLNFVSSIKYIFKSFPPLDPRSPLDLEMFLHTYTTYVKGILGLGSWGGGGGTWLYKLKM